jgi:hypothetical protein
MGTWRRPKGSIIQPLPSWNLRNMYGGGFGGGPVALGDIWAVGLQNNGRASEWLVVWDVQITTSLAGKSTSIEIADCTIMHGNTGPSAHFQSGQLGPLCSQVAAGPGLSWLDIPSQEQGVLFQSLGLPLQGYQWPHDWPFCAIGPGDSLVVFSDANPSNHFGASFIYEVVPGTI